MKSRNPEEITAVLHDNMQVFAETGIAQHYFYKLGQVLKFKSRWQPDTEHERTGVASAEFPMASIIKPAVFGYSQSYGLVKINPINFTFIEQSFITVGHVNVNDSIGILGFDSGQLAIVVERECAQREAGLNLRLPPSGK